MVLSCLYQFKYFRVEATALSVLINHYPLRQKGSDVGRLGADSTLLTDDSTDSLFYKPNVKEGRGKTDSI